MQQLSGLDAVFLNLETNAVPMHIGSLIILDPTTAGPGFGFARVRQLVAERLHLLPGFRRRLLSTPWNLDQPYWLEDPDFDIENHVRHRALPAPGNAQQLSEFICDIFATRLDRERPLWVFYYIEGLEGGKVACLSKIHHACIDGLSGAELLSNLLDTTPQGREVPPPEAPWMPDEIPTPWKLTYTTAKNVLSRPGEIYRLARETLPLLMSARKEMLAQQHAAEKSATPTSGGAPRMRFNTTITSRRSYAFRTVALADIKLIKNAFGVSVNDVVLTVCAEALRNYLLEKKELPRQPLVAAIPVSVRSGDERGAGGNRVTMARAPLGTHIADPVERLLAMSRKMGDVKKTMKAIPARLMLDWADAPPPAVMAQAARLYENFSIQNYMSPPFNLVISNVPGPPGALYFAGARVEANFPVSIPYHGLACNITVFSLQDNLDIGITAHRGTVPDIDHLMDLLVDAVAVLKQRAGAQLKKAS
ncbi:MAG TPA: wax ester/triacylglycerol synthase family O-acyltransferase [Nevskiaceae bacterium]|nr:wax ester/triacylglycerol synthase family O-acyltransferase [Nevskiaceae bacterium]